MRKPALLRPPFFFVIFVVTFCAPHQALAQAKQPTPVELTLLHYKMTNMYVPWEDIANHFEDYRRAQDEFQRREIGARVKQTIDATYSQISKDQLLLFRTNVDLGEYRFNENGFPTSFSTFMYHSVQSQIRGAPVAIVFLNSRDVQMWPVDTETARSIASRLGRYRQVAAEIEYRVQRAREDQINYVASRILDVKIERIRFIHRGALLGVFEVK